MPSESFSVPDAVARANKRTALRGLEDRIERAGTVILSCLLEIERDPRKLYLVDYESWDDYCLKRWNMTPGRVRQIRAAKNVLMQLQDCPETAQIASTLNERQLREINSVEPAKRVAVVLEAKKRSPKITSTSIRQARAVVIDSETGKPESLTVKRCIVAGLDTDGQVKLFNSDMTPLLHEQWVNILHNFGAQPGEMLRVAFSRHR